VKNSLAEYDQVANTACPLCKSPHELRTARNRRGTLYVSCPTWQSTVFFKTAAGIEWLRSHDEDRSLEEEVDDLEDG